MMKTLVTCFLFAWVACLGQLGCKKTLGDKKGPSEEKPKTLQTLTDAPQMCAKVITLMESDKIGRKMLRRIGTQAYRQRCEQELGKSNQGRPLTRACNATCVSTAKTFEAFVGCLGKQRCLRMALCETLASGLRSDPAGKKLLVGGYEAFVRGCTATKDGGDKKLDCQLRCALRKKSGKQLVSCALYCPKELVTKPDPNACRARCAKLVVEAKSHCKGDSRQACLMAVDVSLKNCNAACAKP